MSEKKHTPEPADSLAAEIVEGVLSLTEKTGRISNKTLRFSTILKPDGTTEQVVDRMNRWVAGKIAERDACADINPAAVPVMVEALRDLLKRYRDLVDSGDCGCWDSLDDDEVVNAIAALQLAGVTP